jgi:hypothetical protein
MAANRRGRLLELLAAGLAVISQIPQVAVATLRRLLERCPVVQAVHLMPPGVLAARPQRQLVGLAVVERWSVVPVESQRRQRYPVRVAAIRSLAVPVVRILMRLERPELAAV